MFRHNLKLSLRILNKPIRHSIALTRLYRTSFNINAQEKQKDEKGDCPHEGGSGRGFYYSVGAFVIGTGAIVAYAKHEPEFRSWLRDNVPGSDEFIAFVTAEETSHVDFLTRKLSQWGDAFITEIISLFEPPRKKHDVLPPCDEEQKPYVPPRSAIKPLTEVKKEPEIYAEQRLLEKEEGVTTIKPVESTVRKGFDEAKEKASELSPLNLLELEQAIGVAAQDAIKAYTAAICVLRDQADDIYRLVEESVEKVDPNVLSKIKVKTEERDSLLKKAEDCAQKATEAIQKLLRYLEDPKFPGSDECKAMAQRNTDRVIKAVDEAKKTLEQEKARVSVTDKYWAKVQEARRHFSEELETLFPSVKLSEKNMKIAEGDLDLFILYAFQNILYYQKELSKIDTISKLKLNKALEQSKLGDPKAIECAVEAEMDKERRKIGLEFQKRMFALRAECEREMRLQMKRQAEAHSDHLEEAMKLKEKEIERKMLRTLDEQINVEKNKFKTQLAGMIGRLKGLDDAMKKRANEDKKAQQSQILWSACQSLEASLRSSPCSAPWTDQLRPLQNEINAISKAAAPGDELVEAVVAAIPREAVVRGVYTEAALRDRFLKVERVARRVALLPDGGASIPVMFLSYLQSLFIIKGAIRIPAYELANEPFEPAKFNTFDILQRARFWLDRGDFAQCLRYMNLLEGAPRAVARDWIMETRIFLETQQAATALMAHASASGLVYS